MEIVDARARAARDEALGYVQGEARWLAFYVALSALTVVFAVHEVAGIAPWLWWFVAGAATGDLLNATRSTCQAWRELRRIGRCSRCLHLAADQDDAHAAVRRCGRSGHDLGHDIGKETR